MKRTPSLVVLALGFLLASTPVLRADHWTAVGSTGTVDEAALGFFGMNGTQLGYRAGSASVSPIVARYNVTNTTGQEIAPWNVLELGYTDNAVAGQITAQLFQVNRCTGARVLLCSVTSVDAAAPNCARCTFGVGVDFSQFLYYVEVTVSRTNAAALPTANTLRIL